MNTRPGQISIRWNLGKRWGGVPCRAGAVIASMPNSSMSCLIKPTIPWLWLGNRDLHNSRFNRERSPAYRDRKLGQTAVQPAEVLRLLRSPNVRSERLLKPAEKRLMLK